MSIAADFRAETKRIIADFLAKGERYEGADWCGVRPADVTRAAEIMQTQEDQLASCTCQRDERPFPVNPRNRPIDYHWQMTRLKRMAAEDAAMQERGMI